MENIKENITLAIEEKPKTEHETVKQYNQRIYRAKRAKILAYKKQFYANKVKFISHLQPIRLTGKLKRQSNTILKKAYVTKKLILQVGEKRNIILKNFMIVLISEIVQYFRQEIIHLMVKTN
jgi:hypothetical protein